MNTPTQIFLAISLSLMFQPRLALRADADTPVTVEQLLRMGMEFDGKEISVVGYYTNGEQGSCLFADSRATKNSQPHRRSIWIDETTFNPGNPPSPPIGISDLCALKKRYVRILGHFRYCRANQGNSSGAVGFSRGFGPGGLWQSEITNIVNFRTARKTANDPKNPCSMYQKK